MDADTKLRFPCLQRYKRCLLFVIFLIAAILATVPLVLLKPWQQANGAYNGSNRRFNNSKWSTPNFILPNETIIPSPNNSVQPNRFTPPLDQPFDYSNHYLNATHKMRGVNLGGWLVLEPFITPSLFDPFVNAGVVDEYTLCQHLGPTAAHQMLETHYASWVTEDTFVRIRHLGLNHVRIPIGYWALGNLNDDEPYVPSVSWRYLLRAIEWARKNGIRVMVELHAAPGSQNGWNHSGQLGTIHWLNGTMGEINAQRTVAYLEQLAEFFTRPEYIHVTPTLSLLNEPAAYMIGADKVMVWSAKAIDAVRKATSRRDGNDLWLVVHDGFLGLKAWAGFKSRTTSGRLILGMFLSM
ncbi:hypothetical protein BGZ94_003996, partial [Podila epigama]